MSQAPVITIDGPSGTGKGTIARKLADFLGWHFLDSGALYRIVAVGAQEKEILLNDIKGLRRFSEAMKVAFSQDFEDSISLNGKEISSQVRLEETAEKASLVAAIPEIRSALLKKQLIFRQNPGLVADGRDMGTVVFPDAELKFYLTASPEERAQRRYKQLINKGVNVNLRALLKDIASRDERDTNRKVSPLRPADDAVVIDTTSLTIEQVLNRVLAEVKTTFPVTT
ncbi:MAG: (d)CMP kinase [Gammaproteobacteria bacterium]|nr:(d)CMP kinase [Gammaproteobacteria bacterium]